MSDDIEQKRLSIERYAMELAFAAAKRSEDPYVQVGSVALNKDNRVVGCAYNGLAPGVKVTSTFWTDRDERRHFMFHAEQNLCSLFKRGQVELVACTVLPCSSCATLLCSHGVKRVLYFDDYQGSRAKEIFAFHGVALEQIQ
jgi:dCMP deaminase